MSATVRPARVVRMEVPAELAGQRLDQALAGLVDEYSRSYHQVLIRDHRVTLNGAPAVQKSRVRQGDVIVVRIPAVFANTERAEPIGLSVVYEDGDIIVIDKPAGLVVHPGAGNPSGTLMNALLNHCPALAALPRAGIVHRLDKDTSGILVVAKNEKARHVLIEGLKNRQVARTYRAICQGRLVSGGTVDAPVGRHPRNRLKMAVAGHGKPAVSHFRVVERFRAHTDILVSLETGRTHQIRVHMAHIGHPLVGDPLYGGRLHLAAGLGMEAREALIAFPRQALHALRLEFDHPASHAALAFEAPLPADFLDLVAVLRRDNERAAPEGAAR